MDSNQNILGYGAYSPVSQIRVRMWSFGKDAPEVEILMSDRIRQAVDLRHRLTSPIHSDALRLIHSESDLLPGIIADLYGEVVVVQLMTAGAYHWRDVILRSIAQITGCRCLIERSDAETLGLEGLQPVIQTVFGEIPEAFWMEEHGLRFRINPFSGQKTGFYMDQRENRLRIRSYAAGKRVLDCFSYSGGFSLNALVAGAESVELVDSSEQALDLSRQNLEANNLDMSKATFTGESVFTYLRKLRDRGSSFDLIVLDPPKLAPTQAQVEKAARAYKDINLLAMKLLSENGILFTFSCSGGLGMDLFKKIIADAALDAGRSVRVLEQLHQSFDHPVLSTFPEGEYLKGLICSVK
jgi:23S rRNA (cytosine1962-C5)-methyltransferase